MNKINNKLILILGILVFIFGLFLASPAYALENGIIPFPYYDYNTGYRSNIYTTPIVYPIPVYYPVPVYNTQTVLTGCEGRNTGFSTTTGQSCVGNYINNTNTSNNSSSTSSSTTTKNSNTNTAVSKNTNTSNNIASVSDVNENYGSLAANALLGSNSFMPSGLAQWIFLIIIILAIIFLWRYVYAEEEYLAEPMKHS
jgi:hypothetical protein